MDNKTLMILGIIAVIIVLAYFAIQYIKKKNITKMFEQLAVTSRQVPKSKRNSFILLMFMESMSAPIGKNKAEASMSKFNNPKYLEIQMLQMSKLLKDSSNVSDKKTKQALKLYSDFQTWEENKKKAA